MTKKKGVTVIMNEQQNREHVNARSTKKRGGRRMNFVDWLLVLIALACIGAFVYFAFFSELDIFGTKEEKASVQYTVKIENVNADMLGVSLNGEKGELNCDFIDTKDKVYDCKTGNLIGRVTSVRYERSLEFTGELDEHGSPVYAPYADYIDIIITISASGSISDERVYSINGYEIRVGADIEFRTEGYTAIGKCTSVTGKEIVENAN